MAANERRRTLEALAAAYWRAEDIKLEEGGGYVDAYGYLAGVVERVMVAHGLDLSETVTGGEA